MVSLNLVLNLIMYRMYTFIHLRKCSKMLFSKFLKFSKYFELINELFHKVTLSVMRTNGALVEVLKMKNNLKK